MKELLIKLQHFQRLITREFRPELYVRPMTDFLKAYKGNLIGVAHGYNTKAMLISLPNIKKMYLIDAWDLFEESRGETYEYAKKNLKKFKDKTVFIKKFSDDAVNDLPEQLDFIYIDAGKQTYEQVIKDIRGYYKKVRKGGVIGGHDFDGYYLTVCEATIDFSREKKVKLYTSKNDWWIVKNE